MKIYWMTKTANFEVRKMKKNRKKNVMKSPKNFPQCQKNSANNLPLKYSARNKKLSTSSSQTLQKKSHSKAFSSLCHQK